MPQLRPIAAALASALVSAAFVAPAAAQTIVSEGVGERRAELDKMVFRPAPMAELLAPSDWIGEKPGPADLSGKAVLVFTWAEWYRPSHAVAMLSQRMLAEFGDDGLVVIGVHDGESWDEAQRFAQQRRLGFPIVRDEGGAIREALLVDQDPDIYVIDRAGQLRFADISTESARAAVQTVVGEDPAAASTVRDRLAQQAAEAERAARLPSSISDDISFADLPNIAFAPPTPEEYQSANWPKAVQTDTRRSNRRGNTGPQTITLPGEGWFRGRQPSTDGKVLVIYNWHPFNRESMDQLMFRMDDLQRQLSRDVVVVGLMAPYGNQRNRQNSDDPIASVEITTDTIERFVGSRRLEQYLIASPTGSPVPDVAVDNTRFRGDGALTGAVAVVSTDGTVRRAAHWSDWDDIRRSLDQVLRVDPGVKARRAAEEIYIRGRK